MTTPAAITAALVLAVAAAAAAAQQAWTPQPRTQDGITYLTGGVGVDEREQLRRQSGEYNLHLSFVAEPRGKYLGAVRVTIEDATGRALLQAPTDGPWFFAKLPAGTYTVFAESHGHRQSQRVEIAGGGRATALFRFPYDAR